jgi:hypothetical protein
MQERYTCIGSGDPCRIPGNPLDLNCGALVVVAARGLLGADTRTLAADYAAVEWASTDAATQSRSLSLKDACRRSIVAAVDFGFVGQPLLM